MRKSYSEGWIFDLSKQTGRSPPTLRRWARQGCDLDDPEALKAFLERMDSRKPAFDRRQKRNFSRVRNRPHQTQPPSERAERHQDRSGISGDGEVPVGKRGAQFALRRLELEEAQAYARLQEALIVGNPLAIDAAQSFWLRCSEVLRRLDLAVELARRDSEEMVPKRLACDVALAIADWLRISFAVFLSSETLPLMGLKSPGEFKAYAFERFKSILHLTVRRCPRDPDGHCT
jgi:hypothetical protein